MYVLHVHQCTVHGNTDNFEVKVGMHKGSALSRLLFETVMEAMSREFRDALPWELLYADNLVVIEESKKGMIKKLDIQDGLQSKV